MIDGKTHRRSVLVTGANGYVGSAVTRAFCAAGWKTFGLIRRREGAADLARHEVQSRRRLAGRPVLSRRGRG